MDIHGPASPWQAGEALQSKGTLLVPVTHWRTEEGAFFSVESTQHQSYTTHPSRLTSGIDGDIGGVGGGVEGWRGEGAGGWVEGWVRGWRGGWVGEGWVEGWVGGRAGGRWCVQSVWIGVGMGAGMCNDEIKEK